ncbi:MAG: RNA-binding S4 domain-containing protein [Clostridia bacterium]|nr:RNA-binding S4 domain-containing protein [Clostridia bacterium]
MRLDKFLKLSRIIKRRTVAGDACDAGRVMLDGRVLKASYQVKPGDVLNLTFGEKTVKFRVLYDDEKAARAAMSPMAEEVT